MLRRLDDYNRKRFVCFGDWTIRIGNAFVCFCENLAMSAMAIIDFILYLHLDGERTAWKNQRAVPREA